MSHRGRRGVAEERPAAQDRPAAVSSQREQP